MKSSLLLLMAALLATACIAETKKAAEQEPYFSVKEFMEKEIVRYSSQQRVLYRVATVNEEVERDTMRPGDSTTWAKLFSQLLDADINKPALQGSYDVTTDTTGPQLVTQYTAKKEDLKVQHFIVEKNKGQVVWLFIEIAIDNFVYGSDQTLTYYPDSLYEIKNTQKVLTGNAENWKMSMHFP